MAKFAIKKIQNIVNLRNKIKTNIPSQPTGIKNTIDSKSNEEKIVNEIKEEKVLKDMTTAEKIQQVSEIVAPKVKRTKKDKGLIERTESSTIILTEDNKELLND